MIAGRYACLFVATAAGAQVLLNPPPRPDVIRVDVELVNVLATVRDGHGAYVRGLKRDDFEILVDGRPRPIAQFAPEVDSPLTVALLVDVSGSVAAVIPAEKEAAARFFEQVLRPRDQALLAGFAQYIAVWQDLTPSISAVQEALARAAPFSQEPDHGLGVRPRGGTLLNDAVTLVASQKLKTLAGRKAMVLITDGMDNGSIANEKKAVEAAQQADAVIYGIRYEDPRFRRMGGGMPAPAAPLDHGLGSLERLASPTGGRAFDAMRKGGVEAAFDAIGEEMRNQYGIGFAPDAKAPGEPQFHKLEVKVRRRGLKAQTRGGYYR